MDVNLNNSECLLTQASFFSYKVTNLCTGDSMYVWYTPMSIMWGILSTLFILLIIALMGCVMLASTETPE